MSAPIHSLWPDTALPGVSNGPTDDACVRADVGRSLGLRLSSLREDLRKVVLSSAGSGVWMSLNCRASVWARSPFLDDTKLGRLCPSALEQERPRACAWACVHVCGGGGRCCAGCQGVGQPRWVETKRWGGGGVQFSQDPNTPA